MTINSVQILKWRNLFSFSIVQVAIDLSQRPLSCCYKGEQMLYCNRIITSENESFSILHLATKVFKYNTRKLKYLILQISYTSSQWLNADEEQFTNYLPDLPTPDFPIIAILIFRWLRENVFARFPNSGETVTKTAGIFPFDGLLLRRFKLSISKNMLKALPKW